MNITEKKAKLGLLGTDLKELTSKEDRTQEDYDTMKNLMSEMDTLKDEIEVDTRVAEKIEEMKPKEPKEPEEEKELRIEFPEPEEFEDSDRGLGEFLQAVVRSESPGEDKFVGGAPSGRIDQRLMAYQMRTMKEERAATGQSEGITSKGGFMLQPQFATQFLTITWDEGSILNKCKKLTLSPQFSSLKIPAIDEASRAEGSNSARYHRNMIYECSQIRGTPCVSEAIPSQAA